MTRWPDLDSLLSVPLGAVGSLKPCEVLYEFDGPCIFTAVTPLGTQVLAYFSEELEDEHLLRYLVATTSDGTVGEMKKGVIAVREALERGSLWLVDVDPENVPLRAFALRRDQLPKGALPAPGTMLWASLEPVLTIRLEGDELQQGRIPAAALSHAAEISSKAFKPLFEWAARALGRGQGGRNPDWLRRLYTLPAQRVAFGSLEVSFGPVHLDAGSQSELRLEDSTGVTPEEIQETSWSALRDGLEWIGSNEASPTGTGDGQKWLAVLECMKRIGPGSSGPVTATEIWGSCIGSFDRTVRLDRRAAARVRSALTELKKNQEIQMRVFTGRVRDLDLDKLTLILRDGHGQTRDVMLVLDEERLLETAREAHYQELAVNVAARSQDGKLWSATDIEFVGTAGPSGLDGES